MVDLVRLRVSDKTWDNLETEWRLSCSSFEEEFDQFAMASLPVLRESAMSVDTSEGVFALVEDGKTHAVCRANSVLIPGYDGRVLRIRHTLMSPDFDFGEKTIEDYARVLSRLFVGAVRLSVTVFPSPHIKFHLRSIADRQFFSLAENALSEPELFSSVKVRGSWLFITKA